MKYINYDYDNRKMIQRDWLALDRTLLAYERTHLAYLRTIISFLVAALTFSNVLSGWKKILVPLILAVSAVYFLVLDLRMLKRMHDRTKHICIKPNGSAL